MVNLLNTVVICISSLICCTQASYLEYDGWLNINLFHALNPAEPDVFTPRGNVTITNLNSGTFSVSQGPLTRQEQNQLKNLAKANQIYRLKSIVIGPDGEENSFLTSSKACALASTHLSDVLWLTLNYAGSVLSISQTVSGGCDAVLHLQADALSEFNTDVFVKHTELAPIPDTASFVQKVEREREARDRGEVKDNRGFLAKYWMYIVPVVILVFLTSAAGPEAGQAAAR